MPVRTFETAEVGDYFGTRPVVLAGAVLLGLGLVLASRAASQTQFLLAYGLIIGVSAGSFFVPMMTAVSAWVPERRSLAVSLVSTAALVLSVYASTHASVIGVAGITRCARPEGDDDPVVAVLDRRVQIVDDPLNQRGKVVRVIYQAGDDFRTSGGTQPRSWMSNESALNPSRNSRAAGITTTLVALIVLLPIGLVVTTAIVPAPTHRAVR